MRTTTTKRRVAKSREPSRAITTPSPAIPATPKSRRLEIAARDQADADRQVAEGALLHYPSAVIAVDFAKGISGELPLMDILGAIRQKAGAVNAGSLADAEALLMSQALALNTIFGELARRAAMNMSQYLDATDKYMRLALKAQGQCRATLETLATIKNPPVVFAKQANIANGPQQVNNGTGLQLPSRAENARLAPNELLEKPPGRGLDSGTAPAAFGSDTALATVGAIDRTTNP